MGRFRISSKQNREYTLISNEFIDGFLADANDAQIKVYLYLLRQITHSSDTGISAMADLFNYTEKDIMRALNYWEKKGVLRLSYDEHNNITQVLLCDLTAGENKGVTMPQPENPAVNLPVAPVVKTMTYLTKAKEYIKPEYTLEQLSRFKSKESTTELVFIAESYLGKTLSANDIRTILFISEELHFSTDLIDYLLQYCIDRGKRDFRYIEKVAINWAQNHITTPAEAESFSSRYNKDVYTVMHALGKNNLPTPKEAEYIKRWYQIYGFTSDIVLEACERTVMATDKHRFEYADKILSNWKQAGVHHKPDIARVEASHSSNRKTGSNVSASRNKFNQFQQNDYDFDTLEKELLSN